MAVVSRMSVYIDHAIWGHEMERENDRPALRQQSCSGLRHAVVPVAIGVLLVANGLYWYASADRKLVFIVLAVFALPLVTLFALSAAGILSDLRRRIVAFGTVLMYSCLLFAVLFPPFSAADEFHHYLSSYWLSDCVMGTSTIDSPRTLEMRRDDWELYSDHGLRDDRLDYQTFTIDAGSYQKIADEFSWGVRHRGEIDVPDELMFSFTLGNENAVAKVGSVLGLVLGRLLGLGAYPVFYLGRIFSAAFFVTCALVAYRLTPVGKNVIAGVSLLPMTLHLAASYSYDGGTIGLSFVFIAFVLRGLVGEGHLRTKDLVGLAVTAVLLAPCKAIYVLEVGLVLLVPSRRFASRRFGLAFKLGVLALAAAMVAIAKLSMVATVSSGTSTFTSPGATTYTLTDLVSDPLGTASLFFGTLFYSADSYWMTTLGSSLGWLQPNLASPAWLMGAYVLVLLYVSQAANDDRTPLAPWLRVALLLVSALVWLAAMLSMAVSWTPNTAELIQGVQGRYLLPVLPLLLLGLRSGRVRVSGDAFTPAVTAACTLNALLMVSVMARALMG